VPQYASPSFGYFFFILGLVLLALIIYAMVSRLVH
jgi:hypothetical protein